MWFYFGCLLKNTLKTIVNTGGFEETLFFKKKAVVHVSAVTKQHGEIL